MTNLKNKIILISLIGAGLGTTNSNAQYSQGGWKPITETELNRLKISEDSIQITDLTKNKDSPRYIDNSKRGRKFIDVNGQKYFWYNPNPTGEISVNNNHKGNNFDRGRELINQPKVEKEKLTKEQELEALVNDPEIKNLIKDFNSSFQVEWTYAYLGEDIRDKTGLLWKKGYKTIIPLELQEKYPDGTILVDKQTSKDVLLIKREPQKNSELKNFLEELSMTGGNRYIKNAICRLVSYGKRDYPQISLETLEEKKNFIRPYFTDSIPNTIKNLPKYKAPLIYKDEWLMHLAEGKQVKYENNIKLDFAKPAKSIEMNEQKLDEILKGDD